MFPTPSPEDPFSEHFVLYNTRRWTKSKNTAILSVIHHHENHLDFTSNLVAILIEVSWVHLHMPINIDPALYSQIASVCLS
jgi:hypothetical protein